MIIIALVPVTGVIAIGWLAGKFKILDPTHCGSLSEFVLGFSLPAYLFVGIVRTSPDQFNQWTFPLGIMLGFLIPYLLVLAISICVSRQRLSEGALRALSCSFPNMGGVGLPILKSVFGVKSVLVVLVGNLVTSLILVPLTLALMEVAKGSKRSSRVIGKSVVHSMRQPLVWGPALGALTLFAGVSIPNVIITPLELLGNATFGVSLFALGLLLSRHRLLINGEVLLNVLFKNVGQPILFALLVFVLKISGNLSREMILLGAFPTASITSMLALRYKTYTAESSSMILLSTILSILTIAGAIALIT